MREPSWWYGPPGAWQARLLAPAGSLYGAVTEARWFSTGTSRASVPVVCVGNYTAGGVGKTPTAIAVARLLQRMDETPVFLSRGYGGRARAPTPVDPQRHTAAQVGDEPLLLARIAATVIAANRPAGAALAERLGASVIVMDDGFQNPSLAKDLAIVAVDAALGLGNGRVMPAGPLRAPLALQMARTDVLLVIGEGAAADSLARAMLDWRRPVLRGRLVPTGDTSWLQGARVLAFAGIGRPEKFFATLRALGAELAAAVPFPDHHVYSSDEASDLLARAEAANALPVTTEKDWVRLSPRTPELSELKRAAQPLPVELQLDDGEALTHILQDALAGWRAQNPALAQVDLRVSR